MAPAALVMTDLVDDAPALGNLFNGLRFFVTQRCPSRSFFIQQVKANGGQVVLLDRNADMIIVDHLRKDCPPGSHSYTFIEKSVANGALEDSADHVAVPAEQIPRPVGSTARPAKTATRTAFTAEDDRVLAEHIKAYRAMGGTAELGNRIFQVLEAENNRHTFQSWRDRWVKILLPRLALVKDGQNVNSVPATPPIAQAVPIPATLSKRKRSPSYLGNQNLPPTKKRSASQKPEQDVTSSKLVSNGETNSFETTASSKPPLMATNVIAPTATLPVLLERPTLEPSSPPKILRHVDPVAIPDPLLGSPTLNLQTNLDGSSTHIKHPNLSISHGDPTPTGISTSPLKPPKLREHGSASLESSPSPKSPKHWLKQQSRRSFTPIQGRRFGTPITDEEVDVEALELSEHDINLLRREAHHIQAIPVGGYNNAWDDFATQHPRYSAIQWRAFYETCVLPWFEDKEAKKTAAKIRDKVEFNPEIEVDPVVQEPAPISEEAREEPSELRDAEGEEIALLDCVDVSQGQALPPPAESNQTIIHEISIVADFAKEKTLDTEMVITTAKPETLSRVTPPIQTSPALPASSRKRARLGSFIRPLSLETLGSANEREPSYSTSARGDDNEVEKRQRTLVDGATIFNATSPTKTTKVDRFVATPPSSANRFVEAIAKRRNALMYGTQKVSTELKKIESVSLLSDDEEEYGRTNLSKSSILSGSNQVKTEDMDQIGIGARSSAQPRITPDNSIHSDGDITREDEYTPDKQLLAESVASSSERLETRTNKEGGLPNAEGESINAGSVQLQVEPSPVIWVFEDESLPEDDKENRGDAEKEESQPQVFADAEEQLASPFKAFSEKPKDFRLVHHANSWIEEIKLQDGHMSPAEEEAEDIGMNVLGSQEAEHEEKFESAREQFVHSVEIDGDNEEEIRPESTATNKDTDVSLFLTPSPRTSPSPWRAPVMQQAQLLAGDTSDEEDETPGLPHLDPSTIDTQAIFAQPTQLPDFEIPLSPLMPQRAQRSPSHRSPTKESSIGAGPDYDVPSPLKITQLRPRTPSIHQWPHPGSNAPSFARNHIRSSPPVVPPSSGPQPPATPTSAQPHPAPATPTSSPAPTAMPVQPEPYEIDVYVKDHLQLGYTHKHIIDALRCTTLDFRLASIAVAALAETGALPRNVRGIWTAEDDEVLLSSDAKSVQRLETFHGKGRFNARMDALAVWSNEKAERPSGGRE